MRLFTAGLVISIGLAALNGLAVADVRYSVTELPILGPAGLNNQGQVVGNIGGSAVLFDHGVPIFLGNFEVDGINDSGQVATTQGPDTQHSHAVIYQNGTNEDLGPGFAHAINAHGQVAGGILTSSDFEHAALFSGGTATDLGSLGGPLSQAAALNNDGQVVGYSQLSGTSAVPRHAFLYTNGRMIDLGTLPGGINSQASAINDSGHVVGTADITLGQFPYTHAFLYQNGTLSDLGTLPGGISSGAGDINNLDQIVGFSGDLMAGPRAVIDSGGVMTDLNTLIDPNSGWVLQSASLINDRGQIVASGLLNGAQESALLTPIPEPACMVLMAACCALLIRRRAGDTC